MARRPADRTGVESPTVARSVGGGHLGAAGVINAVAGTLLCYGAASGSLVLPTVDLVAPYLSSEALLREAGTLTWLVTTLGPAVGLAMAVVGGYQFLVARGAVEWGRPRAAAGAGLLNPLTLPLAAVALALFALDGRWRADAGDAGDAGVGGERA